MLHTNMHTPSSPIPEAHPDDWVELVRKSLEGLKFGSIVIVVQDSAVVQIDRTEKLRLDKRTA
jgi:hypothetical protein